MKNILLISLLLLFTFSLKAQSFKTTLNKKVDSINSILEKEKMVRFTNHNSDVFYPKKIKANLQGDVFCVDSVVGEKTISQRLIFNLLKVNSFVIKENEIKAFGQNKKPIVAIFIGNNQNRNALKKELDALRYICINYSKQNPKYKYD
jgi:hypothetical protein